MRAIGLMSGTSLAGVDAALVAIGPRGNGYMLDLVGFVTQPFDDPTQKALLAALPPNVPGAGAAAHLDRLLGECFTSAAKAVAGDEAVDYVASHGLTFSHDGAANETMQIGDPYLLRDALGATVVFDFRRADCAAGGNGAPLVPYVDAMLFASQTEDVVALNLGGIANVTVLPRASNLSAAYAWDTGPGNMLLDAFVRERTNGASTYDRDGAWAERGAVDERVVADLCAREMFYLALPPPKSTGRERFGATLLADQADLFGGLSLEDGCATLCAFTARTVCDSLAWYGPSAARVIASGGGVRNPAMMRMLGERLASTGSTLVTSDDLGIDSDAKEALAFAVLGYETLRGRPANLPAATGARRPAVLGAIVPHGLEGLLAKMRAERAANRAE
ncbi:MAG: anhydro-N-acetylmuramic acid kinase [Candidatus Eremiobacteraeota bacterium]|nr:anhydro-N-acetylmuramic acid kinase [Candidatus Eremiobacteraeota bacterium]